MLSLYPLIAVTAGSLYIYYIKVYSENFKIRYLFLSIIMALLTIFAAYNLFANKNNSMLFTATCVKIIPMIILTLIGIFVYKDKFELQEGIGIMMILIGAVLVG